MATAILVDDEKNALEILEWQLRTYCPQVQVVATCRSAEEGIAAIETHGPQLLFLDIEMPYQNGFDLLRQFPQPAFDVIFTTAYDRFAIKAFRFAALDYLLKPIDAPDLIAAVKRFEAKRENAAFREQLEILLQQYRLPQALPGKVPFATLDGIFFVKPESLVRCESASNYTILHFTDRPKLVISKTLKETEELLLPYGFLRVHHSHLVNLQQVVRYIKTDGGFVETTDGAQVPISRQRKEHILDLLLKK